MIFYTILFWLVLSPIVIFFKKPTDSQLVKLIHLIFPILMLPFLSVFSKIPLFLEESTIESTILNLFYFLSISVTYIGWWECAWYFYYKQWKREILLTNVVNVGVVFLSLIPAVFILIFFLGKKAFALGFVYEIAEAIYKTVHHLICFSNIYCEG